MTARKGRTQRCDREQARTRLDNAAKSLEVAELAAVEREIPSSRSVAAALGVLSGIRLGRCRLLRRARPSLARCRPSRSCESAAADRAEWRASRGRSDRPAKRKGQCALWLDCDQPARTVHDASSCAAATRFRGRGLARVTLVRPLHVGLVTCLTTCACNGAGSSAG